MITIFLHRDNRVEAPTSIERNWISAPYGAFLWVDLPAPSIPDALVLSETFAFHFRDVHDHLVRLPFDAAALDGRLSGLLTVAAGFAGRRWI